MRLYRTATKVKRLSALRDPTNTGGFVGKVLFMSTCLAYEPRENVPLIFIGEK